MTNDEVKEVRGRGYQVIEYVKVESALPNAQIWQCIVCGRERVFFYGKLQGLEAKRLYWLYCQKCRCHQRHKYLGVKNELVH